MAISAGDLRFRVGFFQRALQSDGYGNTQSEFPDDPEFTVSAAIVPKLGGESIQAARLVGRKHVNITVRSSGVTRMVSESWKARDMRSGVDYNIRSIIDPDGKRQWIEMLCEEGVAV